MNLLFVHIISSSWGNMDISKLFILMRIAGFKFFATFFSPRKSNFLFLSKSMLYGCKNKAHGQPCKMYEYKDLETA